jgi:hypothetical protein
VEQRFNERESVKAPVEKNLGKIVTESAALHETIINPFPQKKPPIRFNGGFDVSKSASKRLLFGRFFL